MIELSDVKIGVVGLGYVGLPLACLFATRYPTVGYDLKADRIAALQNGHDHTREVEDEDMRKALQQGICFTSHEEDIASCNVYIVAVPTPVDVNNRPDLEPLISASETVGRVIRRGDVVVYESTVYPGVTEETCLPTIERVSGLHLNVDFWGGYSPERINPGDRQHRVQNIRKVTSGSTPEAAQLIDALYSSVIEAGTHLAPSIKVAEASKIIENSQRDVNIAFVNELAKIFAAMQIDTHDVLDAAASKWNFIRMQPGLVGGHCISVDPYYLIERSQLYGVQPRVMMNARRLNDGMGDYVAHQAIRQMNLKGVPVKDARVLILGFTFKENCPDTRNTKVIDIINTFRDYTANITVVDPCADPQQVLRQFGIAIQRVPSGTYDVAILAVSHEAFRGLDIRSLVPQPGVIYDVKGFLPREVVDARL